MEIINNEAIDSPELATEFGFIEKLCATFGFIKCLNKDNQEKRLFFHSSEVKLGFEEIKMGDYVTFVRGTGNGKPLAKEVRVRRREGARGEGVVVKMAKKGESGSISYTYNNEECFYIGFTRDSIVEPGKLKVKDEVSFERAIVDGEGGVEMAVNVCKKYNKPMRMQGVVTCVKDKYGFIDRLDVVKEIYFNVSTAAGDYGAMVAGSEVEFNVKHLRNGKEEAVNLRLLEKGTVKLEDVYDAMLYGTLLRCPESKRASSTGDQLTGNISYACPSEATVLQIPFADKDKLYPYSLHPGDIVAFKVAVDRRDELHHACQVHLCLDQFPSRKETRHYGVIKMYDPPAGLIEGDLSGSRVSDSGADMLVAFKDKEWLEPDTRPLTKFMAVSFTPMQSVRQFNGNCKTTVTALRIMALKPEEKMTNLKLYPADSLRGVVKTAVQNSDDLGIIICQLPSSSDKRSIPFTLDDIANKQHLPKIGDEVVFGCLERITNKNYLPPAAFDVKVILSREQIVNTANNSSCSRSSANNTVVSNINSNIKSSETRKIRSKTLPDNKIAMAMAVESSVVADGTTAIRGWVVILKEFFGFVETFDHRTLYKFSPSTLKKSNLPVEVTLGSAVEFTASSSSSLRNKRVVEVFTKVLKEFSSEKYEGTIEQFCFKGLQEERHLKTLVLTKRVGTITQTISITENTDSQYHGIIEDCEDYRQYPYTMKSLTHFRTKLFMNDRVMFNVSQESSDSSIQRASDIILMKQQCRVVDIKDNKFVVERFGETEDNWCNNKLPLTFQIDSEKTVIGATLNLEDIVQLDLDLDFETREVFVANCKLIKSAEPLVGGRKVYKPTDDLQSRILHWRKPRLPQGDSIGFSEDLRKEPLLNNCSQ